MTSDALRRPLRARVADALLGHDPLLRLRMGQTALAIALMVCGSAAMGYAARAGLAPGTPVLAWAALSLGGMLAFGTLIRCGWSRRCADPSLTLPQIVFALASGAVAYALAGPVRGGVLPVVMVIVAFGSFQLRPREVRATSAFALALFGAVMFAMTRLRPAVYAADVEVAHFLIVATMLPAMSLLASRHARLRTRLRDQKRRLAEALARIQALATRDELTGLVNRRHLVELLEQEHQRGVRSGHTFCVAMLGLERVRVDDGRGGSAGDGALRRLAETMQSALRVSDVLARWDDERFVLLLSDTRIALARVGVDRLRDAVAQRAVDSAGDPLAVCVAAGIAEHHAGESVVQTLERAERALADALARDARGVAVA